MSTTVYPSSEFVQLAGREVKLQYIEHDGERIEDAAQRIKASAGSNTLAELLAVRTWLRQEFNLPATLRAHCASCYIRVFTNEEFYTRLLQSAHELSHDSVTYRLHWQSYEEVCKTAPLIAVSFRRTHEGECFAVAQVWAPKTNKPYYPTATTTTAAKE